MDIKHVRDIKKFLNHSLNQMYPTKRYSSDEPSYFTYDIFQKEKNDPGYWKNNSLLNLSVDNEPVANKTGKNDITLFGSFNYFCGMRISVSEGIMQENIF